MRTFRVLLLAVAMIFSMYLNAGAATILGMDENNFHVFQAPTGISDAFLLPLAESTMPNLYSSIVNGQAILLNFFANGQNEFIMLLPNLDQYQFDLAGIVSKYIDDTEKNLNNLFDTTEDSYIILFLDEVGSLFGGRSNNNESNNVPIPPTLLLLGSGILGLAGLGLRNFRRKK